MIGIGSVIMCSLHMETDTRTQIAEVNIAENEKISCFHACNITNRFQL